MHGDVPVGASSNCVPVFQDPVVACHGREVTRTDHGLGVFAVQVQDGYVWHPFFDCSLSACLHFICLFAIYLLAILLSRSVKGKGISSKKAPTKDGFFFLSAE